MSLDASGSTERNSLPRLEALGSEIRPAGIENTPPAGGSTYLGILLFSNIIFNFTDLATTLAALSNGLSEGNPLLLGASAGLGLSVFAVLVIVKAVFVTGATAIAFFGMRSTSRRVMNLARCYLLTSTAIFLVVSLNNVIWISV